MQTFARKKNDFHLGPYPTNADGVSTCTKADLQAEAEANVSSGLMDYYPVEECYPLVQISLYTLEAISNALKARTEVWSQLLDGEDKRWKSVEDLRSLYRRALTATRPITGSSEQHIRAEWTDPTAEHEYIFHVHQRESAPNPRQRASE